MIGQMNNNSTLYLKSPKPAWQGKGSKLHL